jgi:hypothetical protein
LEAEKEDQEFQARLGIARPSLEQNKRKPKTKQTDIKSKYCAVGQIISILLYLGV